MAPPTLAELVKSPYPALADEKIRRLAKLVLYDAPVQILDKIKNELFGNAEQARQLATNWGTSKMMSDSRTEIQEAKNKLAGYWSGPAYNQFSSYSSSVVGILDADQMAMGAMGTAVGNCVATVYNTYSSALTLIGRCSADLAGLGAYALLAAGTVMIPGVDLITTGALVTKIIDTLVNFVKSVNDLISGAMKDIGSYRQSGIWFATNANNFKAPEPLPDQLGIPDRWRVLPNDGKPAPQPRPVTGC